MADDPTSDTDDGSDTPEPPASTTPTKPSADKDWQAEADKWKALARKHEKTASDLKPLADKAKELEDAGKSEIERLTEQLGHASRLAAEAEARALRFEVAAEHKLTPAQAKWLQGGTREELEANVADLLDAFGAKQPEKEPEPEPEPSRSDNSRRRPQERLRPGAVPDADTEPEETDPRKLAAMVPRPFS